MTIKRKFTAMNLLLALADDWAFDGKKMFTFLVTCLFIAMIVILLLSGGFVASICIKCLTNHQPGRLCPAVYHVITMWFHGHHGNYHRTERLPHDLYFLNKNNNIQMMHGCKWNIRICCPKVDMSSRWNSLSGDISTEGQHI